MTTTSNSEERYPFVQSAVGQINGRICWLSVNVDSLQAALRFENRNQEEEEPNYYGGYRFKIDTVTRAKTKQVLTAEETQHSIRAKMVQLLPKSAPFGVDVLAPPPLATTQKKTTTAVVPFWEAEAPPPPCEIQVVLIHGDLFLQDVYLYSGKDSSAISTSAQRPR